MTQKINYNLVIVDDHLLVADSLKMLIETFSGYHVLYHAKNGIDLQQKIITNKSIPDLILLDVNMPLMNGYKTMEWLAKEYPEVKVLALSIDDDEQMVLGMLSRGANGYLLKNIHPDALKIALNEVIEKGYYHSGNVANILLKSLKPKKETPTIKLEARELKFLQLSCSELTYAEIAALMFLSPKTIDNCRSKLFNRFQVKNRVGLVIFALKNNLISI
jgi:DNA-binding NarL/FixJ family response regulator